jgi:hypothetical protein
MMDARIKCLIAAHVVAFLIATIFSYHQNGPDFATLSFLALAFADSGLVGLWAALGNARWQKRFSALVGTFLCFWLTAILVQPHRVEAREIIGYFLLIGLPSAVIFAVLSGLKWSARRLALRQTSDLPTQEGIRFSLKHLLIATTAVAVVLAIGRAARTVPHLGGALEIVVVVGSTTLCIVMIELATIWAALGLGRPSPRLLIVLPLAFVVGLLPPFYFNREREVEQLVVWCCLSGGTTIIVASSLLMVRAAGWRLCRAPEVPQADEPVMHS